MAKIILNTDESDGQMFCHVCLSCDRTLFPLGKHSDVYYNAFGNFIMAEFPNILLCWECIAILKKIALFQAKIERSQRILLAHSIDNQTRLTTLSSLTTTYLNPDLTLLFVEDADEKTQIELNVNNEIFNEDLDNKDLLQDIKVKEEIDDCDNANDFDCENTDQLLDEIKTELENVKVENPQVVKKKKYASRTKDRPYKVNKKVLMKDLKEMCKITYIGFDEIKEMLERERNSSYYKIRYKCKTCVLGWSSKEYLERHNVKFHSQSSPYSCDFCNARFDCKRRLSTHMDRHREVFECRSCGHRASSRERIRRHLAGMHRVRCKGCEASFRTVRLFFKHYKQYHEIFVCDYCTKKCKSKRSIEKHIKNHHTVNYRCDECSITFKSKKYYKSHNERKHVVSMGDDAYCVECDKQFKNALLYREHVMTGPAHRQNGGKKGIFPCSECDNTYARKESLKNHHDFVHLKKSRFKCVECNNKQFLNRTKYVNHMKYNHEGVKKEKNKLCTVCGRGFSTNKILIHHIRTHTGERPYECGHCSARFTQKHAMRNHVAHVHLKMKRNVK
ncbi:oocyte zinc finger protein XlCOF6-like [Ostrinia nubilalis]|uniref:oocyte zinc finger protein XlCOF6-like n=2 Tax=Ostrinia TaxID=29056 RepID=UPI0030823D73